MGRIKYSRKKPRELSTKGLTLVGGITHEKIVAVLRREGLEFRIQRYPQIGRNFGAPFFRASEIVVSEEVHRALAEKIGKGKRGQHHSSHVYYYGEWKMADKETFDETQLDGEINYREGKLVERTELYIPVNGEVTERSLS